MKIAKVKDWSDILGEFSYFWKVDDADWVEQRKQEWRHIAKHAYSGCPAKELKVYAQYYVSGINARGENPLLPDRLVYIPPVTRFFLTPFDSAESMRLFFDNPKFSAREKSEIMRTYAWMLSDKGEGLSWVSEALHYFSEKIMGSEYKLLIVGKNGRDSGAVYSPNPTTWCDTYYRRAKGSLLGKRNSERACIEMLGYFVSALQYVSKEGDFAMPDMGSLVSAVDNALSSSSLEGDKLRLAQLLKVREDEMRSNWEKAEPFDVRFS